MLQMLKGLCEHLLAHPADLATYFAEAMHATPQHDQRQHAPTAADVIEHHPRRTISGQHLALTNQRQQRLGRFRLQACLRNTWLRGA